MRFRPLIVFSLLVSFAILGVVRTVQACVRTRTVDYNVSTFVIRVRGYDTFGSVAGQNCACGISFTGNIISTISDVKLVEAGTNTEIGGFDFTPNANTTSAFSALGPGTWCGFLGEQADANLPAGIEVDLLYTVNFLTTDEGAIEVGLAAGSAGSDEANSDGTLTGNHQNVLSPSSVTVQGIGDPDPDPKPVLSFLDKKNFLGGIESWWTTNNPSGPSDWFNVDMDNLAQSCTIAGVCLDVWDRGGLGGLYPRMGIYPETTAFPNTPDIANPLVEFSANISSTDGFGDLVNYSVPCFHLGSGDFHVAAMERAGDSNIWIGSDTDETNLNRSFNTATAYASGAGAFIGNWSLGVTAMPASVAQGQIWINGVTGGNANLNVGNTLEICYVGAAGGETFALFFCPSGVPVLLLLPLAFTVTDSPFFPGPCPNTWCISLEAGCGFVTGGIAIEFCAIYSDAGTGKPTVGAATGVIVDDPDGSCTGCYGRQDDGTHDGFFWKITNPSGPSDWFAVNHGTASATTAAGAGGASMTAVAIGVSEFCGTASSFPTIGIFNENTALGPGCPDVSGGNTSSGVVAANQTHTGDWTTGGVSYDVPDSAINTTTVYVSGAAWASGDTCVWIASDTDGTDDPCGQALPNTLSTLSQNGFTTGCTPVTNWNWAQKINWQ